VLNHHFNSPIRA